MTVVIESPDLVPICPYCDADLHELHGRTLAARGNISFGFGKRYIYSCPVCRKALGISHRKGFWAG